MMHSPIVDFIFPINISSVYLNNKHVFPTDESPTTTTSTFVSISLAMDDIVYLLNGLETDWKLMSDDVTHV